MKFATAIVQQSWTKIIPIRDDAAALFYTRLFELDPSLRSRFKGDVTEQTRTWGTMVSIAVANLERPFILLPTLYSLGAQQEKNGIQAHHYDIAGIALLDTLQCVLGEAFTPEIRAAWANGYRAITNVLKTAGADFSTLAA